MLQHISELPQLTLSTGQIVPVDPSQLQPPLFPRNARDERGTLLTPLPLGMPFWAKVKQRFWEFGDWLRQPSIRYALKTGIGGGEWPRVIL